LVDDKIIPQKYNTAYIAFKHKPFMFGMSNTYELYDRTPGEQADNDLMARIWFEDKWQHQTMHSKVAAFIATNIKHVEWRVLAEVEGAWWWRITIAPSLVAEYRRGVTKVQGFLTFRVLL
jgi:hypothetical protein